MAKKLKKVRLGFWLKLSSMRLITLMVFYLLIGLKINQKSKRWRKKVKRKGIKELKQEARNFKLVFAGSGPFAEPIFESSARKFKDVALIIKRGTPKDSGVFLIAKKNNLKIFEISDKNELHQEIKGLKPDIAIVVSFGIIISGKTLEIPQYGFINVHYSLL